MTFRQRFHNTMHYEPVDRIPMMDFGYWQQTLARWQDEGMPADGLPGKYFGMDGGWGGVGKDIVGMYPLMEVKTVEETADYRVFRDATGVLTKEGKDFSSIPMYLDWLLKDRASWREHFKWRFDPDHPDRVKAQKEQIEVARNDQDTNLRRLHIGSSYGWVRNWMGVENVSMILYDDPGLFEEIIETVSHCIYKVVQRFLEAGLKFDFALGWEDMCFNAGPLISPTHFKQYLVPHFRRISALCRKHGVDVIAVDCDGKIDGLLPLWLDAGVNCMFPVEIGVWQADPVTFRKTFGRDLLMIGGFDKHLLAQSPSAIEKEIRRLLPVVEDGGFIPHCDHLVPPDVSLSNYLLYVRKAKEIWCKNIDVAPTGQ